VAKGRHHRERAAGKLKRKQGRRPPYPRILIVCEGKKTEPQYFEEIRISNRVPTAHVTVLHSELGTQPRQVVDFAEQTFLASRAYEHVYAVFDRDAHPTYHDALNRARALDGTLRNDERKPVTFTAIASVPCFELWLLLHFADIHAYFERQEIYRRVREHMPRYEKGARDVYTATEPHLDAATRRATALQGRFTPHAGNEPYTNADILVSLLRSLRPLR
jgi:hypothetical protein